MAKKIKVKNNRLHLLLIIVLAFFMVFLSLQTTFGYVLMVLMLLPLILFMLNKRKISILTSVVVYMIALIQVWGTDIYSKNPVSVGGCLDICLGDDLIIWIIKLFSVILLPLVIIISYNELFRD